MRARAHVCATHRHAYLGRRLSPDRYAHAGRLCPNPDAGATDCHTDAVRLGSESKPDTYSDRDQLRSGLELDADGHPRSDRHTCSHRVVRDVHPCADRHYPNVHEHHLDRQRRQQQ